jgi:excisionase family DNA binding protein
VERPLSLVMISLPTYQYLRYGHQAMNSHQQSTADAALYDYPSAQTYLGGVSRSTLKMLVQNGELCVINIGRRTLFRRADLDAYIARLTEAL